MSLKQASISLLSTATNKKERKEGKEKTAGKKKSRVGAKETPSWPPGHLRCRKQMLDGGNETNN